MQNTGTLSSTTSTEVADFIAREVEISGLLSVRTPLRKSHSLDAAFAAMNSRAENARRKARAVAILGSHAVLTSALAAFAVAGMVLAAAPLGLLP